MANTLNFADGFDSWATLADMTSAVPGVGPASWDSASTSGFVAAANTRFSLGQAVNFASNNYRLQKAITSTDQYHHVAFSIYLATVNTTATQQFIVAMLDGSTTQCFMGIGQDGYIRLYNTSGTVLATSASKLISQATWTHVEVEFCISSTAGFMNVRLNGNTSNDFATATNLNTRGSSNNYAQTINVGSGTVAGNVYMDDFIWGSGAAAGTWYSDSRIIQLLPTSDAQAQFTGFPASIAAGWTSTNSNSGNVAAGTLKTSQKLTASQGGTVTGVSVNFAAAYTGKWKLAVYSTNASGQVVALLGQTAEQTNSATGFNVVPLTASFTISSGTSFFVALLADTAANMQEDQAGTNNYSGSNAYASGFPANLTVNMNANFGLIAQIAIVPPDAYYVAQATEDGDTTYIYGTNAGVQDLYNLAQLPYTPATIHGVVTKVMSRKDNTGAKTMRVRLKSGSTTSDSTTYALSTTYQYASRIDQSDPNTAAAWQAPAVSVLQIGPGIVS